MSGTFPGQGQEHYERLLKDTRENTIDGPHDRHYIDELGIGGTHLDGWKDIRKNAAIFLYCQNKLSVEQVIEIVGNVAPKYHILALENCKDNEAFWKLSQDMVKHGIDVFRLDAIKNRMAGKVKAEEKRVAIRVSCAPTVISGGVEKRLPIKAKPLTAKEIAVQEALLRAGKRERLLKEIEQLKEEKARKGVAVTDDLAQEIMARNARKGQIIIK
jgi:hypothetical protein